MKTYPKDIKVQLSATQIAALLNAVNILLSELPSDTDRAISAWLSILGRKFMLKTLALQPTHGIHKIKIPTDQAAMLHFLHRLYDTTELPVVERNALQITVNAIDQKLA